MERAENFRKKEHITKLPYATGLGSTGYRLIDDRQSMQAIFLILILQICIMACYDTIKFVPWLSNRFHISTLDIHTYFRRWQVQFSCSVVSNSL